MMPIGEYHPAVERSCPLFAASAGLDSKIGGRAFNDITKPDLRIRNKSRQAHPVRRVLVPLCRGFAFDRSCHAMHLLAFAFKRIW